MELSPQFPGALVLLDYFGIAVFAISGALVAAERRLDFVTFIFFAVVTGVGGGTLRDLLIGAPVFWVSTNATLLICMGAALAAWSIRSRKVAQRALLWFDAAGLAAFAAYGAAKALGYGVAPVPAFVMGVPTACAGGIIRDVLAREPQRRLPDVDPDDLQLRPHLGERSGGSAYTYADVDQPSGRGRKPIGEARQHRLGSRSCSRR